MKSVEVMIRQLTNARIAKVHEEFRAESSKVRSEHLTTEAPKNVQAALMEIRKLDEKKDKLKKLIEKAGYQSHQYSPKKLIRRNSDNEKLVLRNKMEARISTINNLKADAVINTLGVTPEQAKEALIAFREAILKV